MSKSRSELGFLECKHLHLATLRVNEFVEMHNSSGNSRVRARGGNKWVNGRVCAASKSMYIYSHASKCCVCGCRGENTLTFSCLCVCVYEGV